MRPAGEAPAPAAATVTPAKSANREEAKAERQALLNKRRPLAKEIATLESRLEGWQGELKLLEQRLADPALYSGGDPGLLQTLNNRQAELAKAVAEAEDRWLEAAEALAALPDPEG
jgi:ATP-binding cassette subfamily F protein 3